MRARWAVRDKPLKCDEGVLEGTVIPPNSLVAGVPGKVRRETTEEERAHIRANAEGYAALRDAHAAS